MFQMLVLLELHPEVQLTSREMLSCKRVDHVGRHLLAISGRVFAKKVVFARNVLQEGLSQMREDRHQPIIFVHPRQTFGRQFERSFQSLPESRGDQADLIRLRHVRVPGFDEDFALCYQVGHVVPRDLN